MDPFTIRVILSFVIGGLYAATLIWVSEKYGSKIGGILTGIPTTVLVGLIFITLTVGPESAQTAARIIPAMVGVSLVLVYGFTRLLKLGSEIALLLAVVIWAVGALLVVRVGSTNLFANIAFGLLLLGIAGWLTRRYPRNLASSVKGLRRTYIIRVIGAGSVIAGAVIMARVAGPVWGGVFTAFPATFATTLYMLSKAQGPQFARAVARQLPLANGSTMTFAIIFYLTIIPAGLAVAVAMSAIGSLAYAYALLKLSHR